ncbi:MAG: hypothetical protein ACK4P3_00775 [Fimbriimonadaceae bacterium]
MSHIDQDLILEGAFGELEGSEKARFESLIASDPAAKARFEELKQMRSGLVMLKEQSAPLSAEDDALRDLRVRILDRELATRKSDSKAGRFAWGLSLAGAACAGIFALALVQPWRSQSNNPVQLVENPPASSSSVATLQIPSMAIETPVAEPSTSVIASEVAPATVRAPSTPVVPRTRSTRESRTGLVAQRNRVTQLASTEIYNAEPLAELSALVIETLAVDDSTPPRPARSSSGGGSVVVIGAEPDRTTGMPKAAEVRFEGDIIIGN